VRRALAFLRHESDCPAEVRQCDMRQRQNMLRSGSRQGSSRDAEWSAQTADQLGRRAHPFSSLGSFKLTSLVQWACRGPANRHRNGTWDVARLAAARD
jgi:hypothetical protein